MSEPQEKPVEIQQEIRTTLAGSEQFTQKEQEEIAATIEAEVARLLPDLPDGIAEIAARAMGISLRITEKLVGQPNRPTDDQTGK